MSAPTVFISYSHDSQEHKDWTLKLAKDLQAQGVDVTIDQWSLVPGQDLSLFMERGITSSDRVVMVCSSTYVEKAEAGTGGVGYERLIVTEELIRNIDTRKFVAIVRGNNGAKKVPAFMGSRLYIDFEKDSNYPIRLDELARAIHGAPAVSKPPLGPSPFSTKPVFASPSTNVSLDDGWYVQEECKASAGLKAVNLSGYMELRLGIDQPVAKSQSELLDAVRQSEIKAFGWPIAILLENRDEFRPTPYGDGIRAEISIGTSYDYWALRSNGNFFLAQSFFEDSRRSNAIFFDTRIVRVTESLMFAERLYQRLGASPDARINVRVTHRGLRGRELIAASIRRFLSPSRPASEDHSQCEISTVLGNMKAARVEDVKNLLSPMFMLFDFRQFEDSIYEEIVGNFERGIIL